MTNFRALISRMANELDYYRIGKEGYDTSHPLAAEARAALAAEAEGEELRFDGGYESGSMWTGHPLRPAALAAPEPPADGEVAELVADLREIGGILCGMEKHRWANKLTCAADLLSRLAEPEPVPEDQELYDYWISTSPEFGCADPVGYARAVLARWGATPNLAQVRSSLGDGPAVPESREPAAVVEEPSDEELDALLQSTFAQRLYSGVPRTTLEIDFARAVLALWGQP